MNEQAERAQTGQLRDSYLALARDWDRLAQQAEKRPPPQNDAPATKKAGDFRHRP